MDEFLQQLEETLKDLSKDTEPQGTTEI